MESELRKNIAILILGLLVLFIIFSRNGENNLLERLKIDTSDEVVTHGNASNEPIKLDYETEFTKWREAIKKDGPEKAYSDFKKEFYDDHFGIQHSAAHIFGEVLFDEEGISGLVYCDNTFAFGCFHSFFGSALYTLGESVIPEMDRICIEKYGEFGTGCQHGIGHGLLQYSGFNNLVSALELCSLTTQKVPILGCTSGVFMEYNVPLVDLGKSGSFTTKWRELDPQKPYDPCDVIPKKFRESCYYEMGQWWDKIYKQDYSKLGELCENIPDQEFKHSCFLGIGNVVSPTTNYNVSASKKLCGLMPSDDGKLSCLSGASWSFFANPDYRHLAREVCEGIPQRDSINCVNNSAVIDRGLEQKLRN